MSKRTNIDAVLQECFDEEAAAALKRVRFRRDKAPVITTDRLDEASLRALFSRKASAIHVPEYFSRRLASRARKFLDQHAEPTSWPVYESLRKAVSTDMSYGVGMPRQQVRSKRLAARYAAQAIPSIRQIRAAFAPELSPMDRLRLELDELWPAGAGIERFEGKAGFVGLLRVMMREQLMPGIARERGVCHIDAYPKDGLFSASLYVNVPKNGGKLFIWDVNVDARRDGAQNPAVDLIRSAATFRPEIQQVVHSLLPAAHALEVKSGDLVLFDSSRPHSVGGFQRGRRYNIQTWIRAQSDARLALWA